MITVRKEKLSEIDQLAKEKISVFQSDLRTDGTSITKNFQTIRSLSAHIANDYGDRYLLELVQNAYDALDPGEFAGIIKVEFAPLDGEWGTLYIANGGRPFKWKNLESICLIGLSEKPAGENIGNKGLGFRSVTFVSDEPNIFSLADEGENPHDYGYCFRFALNGDFRRWTNDPVALEQLPIQLPPFYIPFPLDDVPSRISGLMSEGFVTVISLPLRGKAAKDSVYEQIELLRNPAAPLLLFLERLHIMEVVVVGRPDLSFTLKRISNEIGVIRNIGVSLRLALVELNNSQRYLVAWRNIPETQVKKKVDESIELRQLHPSWKEWRGDGELAIASRLDENLSGGLLYTFLPMGETAVCPFNGFLHGAFYPQSDRTSLHAKSPLNAMYIEEALKLSVHAALAVRSLADLHDSPLDHSQCGRVITDFLSWLGVPSVDGFSTGDYAKKLGEAFIATGCVIGEQNILPVIDGKKIDCWGAPTSVWEWNDSLFSTITAERVSRLGNIPVLSKKLGVDRINRFAETWKDRICNNLFEPDAENLADVVEKVAEELLLTRADVFTWTKFYKDLLALVTKFPQLLLSSFLTSKRILLCSGTMLLSAVSHPPTGKGKRRARRKGRVVQGVGTVVFSPSDRLMKNSAEDTTIQHLFRVPQRLEQGFSFLSPKLDWYGELDDVRQFMEKNKLVRRYHAGELISNVSRIQRELDDKVARREALTWLFALYTARGDDIADSLSSADIYVPVGKEGWTSAKRAYFSRGWSQSEKLNTLLEHFLESASPFSQEISNLKKRLLHPPTKKPFSNGKASEWYSFLKQIGVNVGLQPAIKDKRPIISLSNISIANIGSLLKLDNESIRIWEKAVGDFRISYDGDNKLSDQSQIFYWPGQGDFDAFPSEVKKLYARLLLDWISRTNCTESELKIQYRHNYYYNAQQYLWPTPLLAFIREAAWFPVENLSGDQKGLTFQCLRDVWLPEEDRDRPRPFMPQILSELGIRQALVSEDVRNRLMSWGNAKILNHPECAFEQVAFLGQIFHRKQVEDYCRREFLNLYGATWKALADKSDCNWDLHNCRPKWIVVRNKGAHKFYGAANIDQLPGTRIDSSSKVYVPDDGNLLACTLLEELGHNVFDFETSSPRILSLIKDLLGSAVVATSDLPVEIFVDNVPFGSATDMGIPLIELVPSFTDLLCLAMECLTGTSAQQLPADRSEIIARLRQIRVLLCREISFRIAGTPTPLPSGYYGTFWHISGDVPCLLLETDDDQITWAHIRQAGPALCRLLNQADLASNIKLACSTMERHGIAIGDSFSRVNHLDALCRDLGLGKTQAETSLEVESGDKRRVEMLLRPLVLYYAGENAFLAYEEIKNQSATLDELFKSTEPLFLNTTAEMHSVYDCVRESNSYSYILKRLNLDFSKFNDCVIKTDGEKSAIVYPDEHKISMKVFLEENRDRLLACLQSIYLARFDKQEELGDFVEFKRQLLSLSPDSSWLFVYEEPSEEIMTSWVNAWLKERGFPMIDTFDSTLPAWSTVVKLNERKLKKFVTDHAKVISEWCRVNSVAQSVNWDLVESATSSIKVALDKKGALDFRELDDNLLLKWIVKAGVWPNGMPESLDLKVLNFTEEDLRHAQKIASDERIAQAKARRSVGFGSTIIDPYEADYEAISQQMLDNLPKDIFKTTLGAFADVHGSEKKTIASGSVGGSGRTGGGTLPRIPPEKTELIGFLGECAVYHWLKARFPKKDIELSWKSKNRRHLFAEDGVDSLGYDFHLEYNRKNWFLEVKASLQNPMMFEMGETEVDKAKECAISGKGEYAVIYVSDIEDPAKMRILVLPNPFSSEGKRMFGRPKEKFRYSFGK